METEPSAEGAGPPSSHPSPWYESTFDTFYQTLYAHRNKSDAGRALAFLRREAIRGGGGAILDLCCGAGRHLIELRRMGCNAVGLDLSRAMLEAARQDAAREGIAIPLTQGSMERVPFGEAFDLVVNLFTSFGYFESDETNAAVMGEVARVLRPGGRFVMDFMNAPWVRATLVPRSQERAASRLEIDIRRSIEGAPPRVVKRTRVIGHREEREIVESVRLFTRGDLEAMMTRAGLKPLRAWGDFDGRMHGDMAPRCILLAELPA